MKMMGLSYGTSKFDDKVDSIFKGLGKELKWFTSINQINEQLSDRELGLLIVSSSLNEAGEEIYEVCRQLSQVNPNLVVILIGEEKSLDIRKAMRSGAFDVLTIPLNQYQVVDTIREAERFLANQNQNPPILSEKMTPTKMARVITVCSTKGGVGKTTFTVNLASAFAKELIRVAVIDLDLQFGDVSMFFDCNPKKTIYEWVKEAKNDSEETIQEYMHAYNKYIDIMPAPIRPEFSEAVLEEHISRLISLLKPNYDLILIDTAPFMEDKILTALDKSDDIFLLTFLDLPTLKNSKIFIDTLKSLSLDNKVKVVLNRDSKRKGLNATTAENVLGLPFYVKIPDVEKIVSISVNEGNPYVYSNPRAKISKIIYSIARDISGKTITQSRKSIFGRKVTQAGRLV